jgi:hypothetical protein
MFGDSNSLCVNLTARHEVGAGNLVDASCKTNSNCLYGLCTLGVCEAPPLTCPSSVAGTARQSSVTTLTPLMWLFSSTHLPIPSFSYSKGTVCSGNGVCTYRDPSWNTLKTCSMLDHFCSATCVCSGDFGGDDCSLTAADLASRDAVR